MTSRAHRPASFLAASAVLSLASACSSEPPRQPAEIDDACAATVTHRYTFTSGWFSEASVGDDGSIEWGDAGYRMPAAQPIDVSGGDAPAECAAMRGFLGEVQPALEGTPESPPVLLAEWSLFAPLPSQEPDTLDPDAVPAPIERLAGEVRFRWVQPVDANDENADYTEIDGDRTVHHGRVLEDFVVEAELNCDRGFTVDPHWLGRLDAPASELAPLCRRDERGDWECLSYTLNRDGDGCLFELAPAAYPTRDGQLIEAVLGGELRTRDGALDFHYTAIELL